MPSNDTAFTNGINNSIYMLVSALTSILQILFFREGNAIAVLVLAIRIGLEGVPTIACAFCCAGIIL